MRLLPLVLLALAGCTSNVSPQQPDKVADEAPPPPDDQKPPEDIPPEDDPVDPVDPNPPDASVCGNNRKDPGESCDGSDLASSTCGIFGFEGGSLGCRGDCSDFDTRNCTAPPPPPLGAPVPIAVPAASVVLNGSLDLTDLSWTRPSEACEVSDSPGRRFEQHRVVNNTGAAQSLTVTATFTGDGFLHAYTGTFDPAVPASGCVAGDDDGGSTQASELTAVSITAGQVLTIVVSTYAADVALGGYSIDVLTIGDDDTPPPAVVCGDGVVEGAELCDGDTQAGDSCIIHGFNRGALGCAAGCAAVDTAGCWNLANAVAIAARGSSVALSGALATTDSKWVRPSESCALPTATTPDRFFDALQIVNNTGVAQSVDLTGTFAADGFLHVFSTAFDPTAPTTGCLVGDDDFNGSAASQLLDVAIAPGQTLVVVVSSFAANAAIGAWSIDVRTRTVAVCGNGIIEGSESCDGVAFGGQTCIGRGHEGGSLSCNASCGPVIETACWDLEAPTSIAAVGGSIALDGTLTAQDPRMDRVSESCAGSGAADHAWDGYRIVNNTGAARTLTVTASWAAGDGFLHAYSAGFDPAAPLSGCIDGDDDFGTAGSQLTDLPIAAGQTLVIVASTFAGNTNIGAYDIEVETNAPPAPPGTPIGGKGLTIQLAGSSDASDASYERLSESCAPTGLQRKFDSFRISNNTGAAQTLTVHGNWSGDGYLHVFDSTFNAASPAASCRKGDDDFGTNASRLTNVAIAAGETLVVVASTFGSTTLGAYTLDVRTEGDAVIAAVGSSIVTKGALHASDEQWNRPSETCTDDGGTATNFHDVHTVKNTSGVTQDLDFTATWTGGDGFLVVYFGVFDPAAPASDQCLQGDDDFSGTTSSKVTGVTIFANEVLTVVATSFAAATPIAGYSIDVRTQP